MPSKKLTPDEKVLEHVTKASLHLLEAADIAWKQNKRDVSDEIRGALSSVENLSLHLLGEKAGYAMRDKILKKKGIVS